MVRKLFFIILMAVLIMSCDSITDQESGSSSNTGGKKSGVVVTCTLEATSPLGFGTHAGVYVWVTDISDDYVCTTDFFLSSDADEHLEFYDENVDTGDNPSEWILLTHFDEVGTPDGVSGATQSIAPNSTLTFTSTNWDFTDNLGNTVAPGTYRFNVQVVGHAMNSDYYYADINIDGSGETVILSNDFGTTNIMTSGTLTYTP